jgi:hypothetical protein
MPVYQNLMSVPTPALLEELNMTPIADAWMRHVVRFWNSLASLPMGNIFARELRVVVSSQCHHPVAHVGWLCHESSSGHWVPLPH